MEVLLGKDELSYAEIGPDGSVNFCVYLSTACDESLDQTMQDWVFDEKETTITVKFTAHDLVDSAVEGHGDYETGEIEPDAKPLFMAMRADFEKAIKSIDALKFV